MFDVRRTKAFDKESAEWLKTSGHRVLYVASFEGKRMSPLQKTASYGIKGARSYSENAPLELCVHFNHDYCCFFSLPLDFFVLRI